MKKQILKTAQLIKELYETDNGSVGGYGHIVFDDGNIETHHIEWCIEEAEEKLQDYSEETRLASLKALESMLLLTEKQRNKANSYFFSTLMK